MKPIAILASGMVTGVGLDSASSCAAIRCAIDNFSETRFMDKDGEWIIGSQVTLEQPWRGLPKLVHMVMPAIKECLAHARNATPEQIPLLLCVAEKERPGRLEGLDDQLLQDVQTELGMRFHPRSGVVAKGRVGGAIAFGAARHLIYEEHIPLCLIAGVDSFLVAETLAAYEEKERLLTSQNSNGFIPGEAGAAVLVGLPSTLNSQRSAGQLLCLGFGTGLEKATIDSEEPLRGDGLVQAIKGALAEAGCTMSAMDFRITDISGGQYGFKEATLALNRTLTEYKKENIDIWHPADCIGDAGVASGIAMLVVCSEATQKAYAPGNNILYHLSNEDQSRAAMVLSYKQERSG